MKKHPLPAMLQSHRTQNGSPPFYIVGGGSFAQKMAKILFNYAINFCFIDEQACSPLLGLPVLTSAELQDSSGIFLIAISIPEYAIAAEERLLQQGVKKTQCLHFPYDSAAILFSYMLHVSKEKTLALLQQPLNGFVSFERRFFAKEWHNLAAARTALPRLGIYQLGRGGGYLEHLGGLPEALAKDYDCVLFSDTKNAGEPRLPQMLMSQPAMLAFNDIDLIITAHVFPCSPPHIKKLSLVHMVYDFLLFSTQTAEHLAQADTHYIVVPSVPSLQLHKNLYLEQKLDNNVVLIPGGYPKHDANIRRFAAIEKTVTACHAILYAPTLSSLAAANETPDCFSILQAETFIPRILAEFPQSTLIFRPHPEDLALAEFQLTHPRAQAFCNLLAFCQSHPRCTVDTNKSCYLTSFAQSKIMITDTSSAGFSFSLLTNRTVIFFAENHENLKANYPDCAFIQDREHIGCCIATTEQLLQQIRLLQHSDAAQFSSAAFCQSRIFNLGCSEQYLLDNMQHIIHDTKHPDWIYLQSIVKGSS